MMPEIDQIDLLDLALNNIWLVTIRQSLTGYLRRQSQFSSMQCILK